MSDTEKELAIKMANHVLDVPYADPDDDLRTIARQFLRVIERESSTDTGTTGATSEGLTDYAGLPQSRATCTKHNEASKAKYCSPVRLKPPMKCPSCGVGMDYFDHGRCPKCKRYCGCSFSPTSMSDYCAEHRPKVSKP